MLWLGAVDATSERLGSGATFPSSSRQRSSGFSRSPFAEIGLLVGVVDELAEKREEDRTQQPGGFRIAHDVDSVAAFEQGFGGDVAAAG